jgi:hypothetical protein
VLKGMHNYFLSAMMRGNNAAAAAMLEDLERIYSNGAGMGTVDLQRFALIYLHNE